MTPTTVAPASQRRGAVSDEDDWAALAAEANPAAFRSLFDKHRKAVYNHCFRSLGDWGAAEDATQAVFLALWRRALSGTISDLLGDTARPILLGMARQECLAHHRSRGRLATLRERVTQFHDRDESANVDAWVAAEDTMGAIREALASLPQDQRDVVELVCWSELTMAQAAQVLRVAEGTVKSRLSRARSTLAGTRAASLVGAQR